ncbi:MAG: biotin/lipoyl-containing protein [Candidatus Limnocylindrales bacterium]
MDDEPSDVPALDDRPALTSDSPPPVLPPDDPTLEPPPDAELEHPTEVPTAADAAAIGRLLDEILPLLIARFRAGRMGELEVRRAGWHVRVRRPADELAPTTVDAASIRGADGRRSRTASAGQTTGQGHAPTGQPGAGTSLAAVGPGRPSDGHGAAPAAGASLVAASPGVGYYATRDGIATGSQVRSGDVLGHVDVLGVRQEVIAPGDGIVARLLAEAGEAVEYGQDLVRLEPVSRTDPVREA